MYGSGCIVCCELPADPVAGGRGVCVKLKHDLYDIQLTPQAEGNGHEPETTFLTIRSLAGEMQGYMHVTGPIQQVGGTLLMLQPTQHAAWRRVLGHVGENM